MKMNLDGLESRFWAKVRILDDDSCWEWSAPPTPSGYGQIAVRTEKGRRPMLAHRVSWILTNGVIPDGICVLHSCDNPPCVNPSHLWLGTKADNNRDKEEKGRGKPPPYWLVKNHRSGEDHPFAKLTLFQVEEIKWLYASGGHTMRSLGRRYGVNSSHVSRIISGEKW